MPRRNATPSRATRTEAPLASSSSSTVRRSSRNPQPRSSRLHVDDTSDAVQTPAQAAREAPGRMVAPGRTMATHSVIVISDDDDSPAHPPASAEQSSSESDIEMLEPTARAFASRIRSTTANSSSARPPVQELMDTDTEDDQNLVRASTSNVMTPAPPAATETQLSPRARTNIRAPRAPKQDSDHLTSAEKKLIDRNKDMSYPNLFILINRNRASERIPKAPLNTVLPIDWHRGSKHWWMGVKRDRPFWKPSDDPYLVRSGFATKDDDDGDDDEIEEVGAGAT
ncbi:unnamed protein product [Jaminaea pallidilutea]